MRKLVLAAAVVAAVSVSAFVGSARADYGTGAVYQIELSANAPGAQGGGVWLWITLNDKGGGDYAGSDCGHGGAGTASDKGDITSWSDVGGTLTITGVVLNGLGGFPTTITVPDAYGHYRGAIGSYLTLPGFIPPFIGFSQLQVAP